MHCRFFGVVCSIRKMLQHIVGAHIAWLVVWLFGWEVAGAEQLLHIEQTEAVIAVHQDGRPVLVYNLQSPDVPDGIDPVYRRTGFLHPVHSPQGLTVTATFPVDHPHQHGIFSAWVKTSYDDQPVDFWNLAGGKARVLHERVVSTFATADSAGFDVDLIHRVESTPPVDVLRERWKVVVYPTDGSHHRFDLETVQTAITDKPLTVHKYHYGGVALRGPTRWLTPNDAESKQKPDELREPSSILNDHGSDRIVGNHQHAKWIALTGMQEGRPVTIGMLCHQANFRSPQAARLHPTKPYFCFAPCVDGEFTIDRDHPYRARYRCLITDAPPDAEWLDRQWSAWHEE
jgi:hypothetical protein